MCDHLSRAAVACSLKRPTRKHDGPPFRFLSGLASNGVYIDPPLLPEAAVVSYTAFSPLPDKCQAVWSLLHFPWGHPRRTLSGILPCEARTFLSRQMPAAITCLTHVYLFYLQDLFRSDGTVLPAQPEPLPIPGTIPSVCPQHLPQIRAQSRNDRRR